jgi:fatty-acyl-CoA synthase
MRRDGDDYFYFVDRVGDTFRWKGENVSTNEVGDIISAVPGVEEANVYGVAVAGADGRAGMAAILPGAGFDLAALHKTVTAALPSYARPMFVRVKSEIETTGTFKYRKVDLISDGFDPGKTSDPLYFDAGGAYAPLTPALYTEIQSGARRL